MLWTEWGTVRYAKMLGTDKVWEVQDKLEAFYFSHAKGRPLTYENAHSIICIFRAELWQFVCQEIIGAGTPWTPHTAKEWKAKLKQAVSPRPDRLVMREKLLSQAEEN